MLKKSMLRILIASTLVLSIPTFAGGGHGCWGGGGYGHGWGGGYGRGCWGGYGYYGAAPFWTGFGLTAGALVLGALAQPNVVYGPQVIYQAPAPQVIVQQSAPPQVIYQQAPPPQVIYQQAPATQAVVQQAVVQQQYAPSPAPRQQNYAEPPAYPMAEPQNNGSAARSDSGKYDIYLPNGNGTFKVIPLTKTSTGFLGPQGEFYPDHPTADQLNQRYMGK